MKERKLFLAGNGRGKWRSMSEQWALSFVGHWNEKDFAASGVEQMAAMWGHWCASPPGLCLERQQSERQQHTQWMHFFHFVYVCFSFVVWKRISFNSMYEIHQFLPVEISNSAYVHHKYIVCVCCVRWLIYLTQSYRTIYTEMNCTAQRLWDRITKCAPANKSVHIAQ